jgi:hypothetical protein
VKIITNSKGKMESELARISKLKNIENWGIWKFQVRIMLNANGSWGVASGKELKPEAPRAGSNKQMINEYQKAVAAWNKADALAQKVIATTIGDQPMLHIINCTSAEEMWNKLTSIYEQKSEASIHMLQQNWFSATKKSSDDMATHISKLEDMAHRLRMMGENISDSMIITKILMTLPTNYRHFVSAWESAPEGERNLVNLTSRLTIEESRNSAQEDREAEALLSWAPRGKSQRDMDLKGRQKTGKCYVCGETGHWARNCQQRKGDDTAKKNVGNATQRKSEYSAGFASVALTSSVITVSEHADWFLDSGASDHMCNQRELFLTYEAFDTPAMVCIGDGGCIEAHGKGHINMLMFDGNRWNKNHLVDVLHVPKLNYNLFSVGAALGKGLKMQSTRTTCELTKNEKIVAVGVREGKLFSMKFKVIFPGEMKSASEEDIMKETTGQGLKINNFDLQGFLTAEDNDSEEPTLQEVKALKMRVKNLLEAKNALRDMEDRKKIIDSLQMKLSQVEQENVELQLLLDTQKKKFSELDKIKSKELNDFKDKFNHLGQKEIEFLKQYHEDEINSLEKTHSSKISELQFKVDSLKTDYEDKIRRITDSNLSLLKEKEDVIQELQSQLKIKTSQQSNDASGEQIIGLKLCISKLDKLLHKNQTDYIKKAKKQCPNGVRTLRTDNGLEFTNREMRELTHQYGIRHQRTLSYTPEQNGSAERDSHTLMEAARTLLNARKFEPRFWVVAVNTVVRVLNLKGTSSVKGTTPHELWIQKEPRINNLRIFGEEVFIIPKQKRQKLDAKAKRGFCVCYDGDRKGYRIWYPEDDTIQTVRDVVFTGRAHQTPKKEQEDNELLIEKIPNPSEEDNGDSEQMRNNGENQPEKQIEQNPIEIVNE